MKILLRSAFFSVFMVLAVACGGGGSSSDDSAPDDSNSVADQSPPSVDVAGEFDGAYSGMQTLVLSLGGVDDVAEIAADVTVSGSSILIDPLTANGSIANNTFIATTNRTSTQGGLTCQFLLTYEGDISFESLNGNIEGTAICDEGGGNQTLDVTGTISATR